MDENRNRYFIVNKPYNMVSQFVSSHRVRLLKHLDFEFPEGIHAIGRLDNHSEGLLILTTNKRVTKLLFQGEVPHKRTYLLKVRHPMSEETAQQLRDGVSIIVKNNEKWTTTPCEVEIVEKPAGLFSHPYERKDYVEHTWLTMTLKEGKFHQVRNMVEVMHHRCIRLIRISIENLELGDLQPGCVREIEEETFFEQLKITNWQQ